MSDQAMSGHATSGDEQLRITRITRGGTLAGLVIAGDIDEYSHAVLAGALAELADVAAEIHLDLAGVDYCDLAGLRAMVRLAESGSRQDAGPRPDAALRQDAPRPDAGPRVVLHAVPRQLLTALRIVGWDVVSGLIIDERKAGAV
jgi:STAS domain